MRTQFAYFPFNLLNSSPGVYHLAGLARHIKITCLLYLLSMAEAGNYGNTGNEREGQERCICLLFVSPFAFGIDIKTLSVLLLLLPRNGFSGVKLVDRERKTCGSIELALFSLRFTICLSGYILTRYVCYCCVTHCHEVGNRNLCIHENLFYYNNSLFN
jgi:hypothetical protein